MTFSPTRVPPLSPVLIGGLALRALPLPVLAPLAGLAVGVMADRHPGVFERLAGLGDAAFLIDPIDLPIAFVLRPGATPPALVPVSGDEAEIEAAATIRGPLGVLIELLEGRLDGDAAFFHRDLVVEGDTAAVVALRNAIDSAEIDLVGDALAALGPLARPAGRIAALVGGLVRQAGEDLELLRRALLASAPADPSEGRGP